jgi:hypothetical protein
MSPRAVVRTFRLDATPYEIGNRTLLRLPKEASAKLPSRGQVAVRGTMNGHRFETVLEPDGDFGHWMTIDRELERAAHVIVGEAVELEIGVRKDWPEPNVPEDLETALAAAPRIVRDLWEAVTPMARWEWVRWINATRNPDTRKRRVAVSVSKMTSGSRRPCCFNLASCTDPELSKNGKLMKPA